MNFRVTISVVVFACVALGMLFGCGGKISMSDLSAQELFTKGMEKYDREKYLSSREYFQTVVFNFPGEPIVDSAQYYLALTYFGTKEYELAGVEFNRLVLNYPSSVYFTHALFMRAVSFFESTPEHYALDQTDLVRAIRQFEDFLIDYPESEMIPEAMEYLNQARTRMARKHYEAGCTYKYIRAYEAAKLYFQLVVDDFTDTEYGCKAAFDIADMEYRQGHFDQARTKFANFTVAFPEHDLVAKAREKAVIAAFKDGEKMFQKGDTVLAREKLQLFIRDYPDSKFVNKAEKYLQEIDISAAAIPQQVGNADSL